MRINFEIKIPKEVKDFRIRHYKALSSPLGFDRSVDAKALFLAELTDNSLARIKMLRVDQIEYLHMIVVRSFSGFEITAEPPKEITINGKVYYRIDPTKASWGWHDDFGSCDLKKDPVRMACVMYHPKGFEYGQLDANDNLINPIASRYEDFKEHFPLDIFMSATGFFLQSSEKSMRISMVKLKAKIQMEKLLRSLPNFLKKKRLEH